MNNTTFTVLGDSIPKGIICKNNKLSFAKNNAINLVENYYNISVTNKSIYGQTLKRLYEKQIIEDVISSLDSNNDNYVIFSIGGNDADYNWAEVVNSHGKTNPNTPFLQFKKLYEKCILKLKSNGIKVILTTMLPISANRYFDYVISKKADKQKVLNFLKMDLTNINRQHERYNMAILEIAQKTGCKVLDVRSEFLLDKNYLNLLCADGIHPNEKGYVKLARSIVKLTKKFFLKNNFIKTHQHA